MPLRQHLPPAPNNAPRDVFAGLIYFINYAQVLPKRGRSVENGDGKGALPGLITEKLAVVVDFMVNYLSARWKPANPRLATHQMSGSRWVKPGQKGVKRLALPRRIDLWQTLEWFMCNLLWSWFQFGEALGQILWQYLGYIGCEYLESRFKNRNKSMLQA